LTDPGRNAGVFHCWAFYLLVVRLVTTRSRRRVFGGSFWV
jgi:hypothetical protein